MNSFIRTYLEGKLILSDLKLIKNLETAVHKILTSYSGHKTALIKDVKIELS